MNLKEFVSYGTLSLALCTTPSIAQGQQPNVDSLKPSSLNADLYEAERAVLDNEPRPQSKAARRFFTHKDILAEHVPSYAPRLWEDVFTTPDDEVLFASTTQEQVAKDSSITTLDKNTTWTPQYLQRRLPNPLHPGISTSITSNYPEKARELNDAINDDVDVTWTSGRRTTLADNVEEHSEFLHFYEDAFTDVNLPVGTVAQLGVESAFDPDAQSYAACGVGQIRRGHLQRISEEQPLPRCDNPVIAKLTANIMKAQMLIYDTPYFESATMYHSGLGNRNKARSIGEYLQPDQGSEQHYYTGLQTMFENSDDEQINDLLGTAGSDTRHYPIQVNALQDIYNDIRDTVRSSPMTTYRVNNHRSVQTIAEQADTSTHVIRDYNPHIDSQEVPSNTYVNLPGETTIPGEDVSTWYDPTNAFLTRLRNHDFPMDKDSLVTDLDEFIDLAEQRGNHWWSGALRFVKHNQEAQNAVRPRAQRRIQRITDYLSEQRSPPTGSRGRR